ncbi:MAG: hypothetical protein IJO63_00580 [Bacilli bacterium]|nr:hypothetical protein [Bacilli bacterium]
MKKDTLLEIILGTIGGLVFAIGMCMCLLPEWNLFTAGVVTAIIGFIILLCIIPVYRKSHPRQKSDKKIDWSLVFTWVIGVVGSLIMGFGMSKILVGEASTSDMIVGIITGVVGLIICILNYPIHAYIKNPRD